MTEQWNQQDKNKYFFAPYLSFQIAGSDSLPSRNKNFKCIIWCRTWRWFIQSQLQIIDRCVSPELHTDVSTKTPLRLQSLNCRLLGKFNESCSLSCQYAGLHSHSRSVWNLPSWLSFETQLPLILWPWLHRPGLEPFSSVLYESHLSLELFSFIIW